MGVSGLAEGFLAGFNTMDRYQRGQKEDERQERELGLRDTMVKQGIEDSNRNYSLRQASFEHDKERTKTADEQWKKEFGLRQKEADGMQAYRNANLGLAQAAESRAKQEHDWQVSERANQKLLEDSLPLIDSAFQARLRGEADPAGYVDLMKNKEFQKGGALYRFNFDRYSDNQHLQDARQIVPQISGLMKDIDSGKLSWENEDDQRAIVQRINSSKIIGPLNTILEQEVKRGIGEVDAASGKKITDKELTHVIPTQDGRGVMYGLKVTYADGSTADSVVTEGRSTQPGDPVKVSKWGDLIKTVYQRSQMYLQLSGAGQNRETLNRVGQSLGLVQQADLKGHKQASVDLIKELNKNVAEVLSSDAVGSLEERQAQAKQLLASYEEDQAKIDSIYGVNTGGTPGAAPSGVNPEQWSQSNPERQQFMREAEQGGWLGIYLESPEKMDGAFALWRQAVAKEEAAKQAAASAERIREIEGPKEPQRPSLAQARQLASANMATGSGKPPQPYGKPVDVMGLIKAHNQSNADKQASDGYGLYQHGYK
ncbi:hypothetical protein ACV1DR_01680 [Aeromonas jandaei]